MEKNILTFDHIADIGNNELWEKFPFYVIVKPDGSGGDWLWSWGIMSDENRGLWDPGPAVWKVSKKKIYNG
jgi:hypothetical protein